MAAQPVPENTRLIKSKRGGDKLLHAGHLYNKGHVAKDGATQWRCDKMTSSGCQGSCKTKLLGAALQAEALKTHNHLPAPERAQQEELRGNLRTSASGQPASGAAKLVAADLRNIARADLDTLPDTRSLKRVVWETRLYERKKKLKIDGEDSPSLEKSLEELVLSPELCTVSGE